MIRAPVEPGRDGGDAPADTGKRSPAPPSWRVRDRVLALEEPCIMGILNVTPDSFSDGGRWDAPDRALEHAHQMAAEGAALVDVGGESTRPGAAPVGVEEELARVLPVVRLLRRELDVLVSVDTRSAEVARRALGEGAHVVNDVSALAHDPDMAAVVAESGAGLVLMHMRGTPQTMQREARYQDAPAEVARELGSALERARAAGVADEAVVLDPGIGFAKTGEQNLQLVARLDRLAALGRPVLLGPSRKRFLGELLDGAPPEQRAVATAAVCAIALLRGARIFRVHDVRVVREALAAAHAVHRHLPAAR